MAPPTEKKNIWPPAKHVKLNFLERATVKLFKGVNKFIPWHKLPSPIGVFNLLALRFELRSKNLYDVYPSEAAQGTEETVPLSNPRWVSARDPSGKFNDLQEPLMGCANMRLGRNVPREFAKAPTEEELLTPNPRLVSERLLKRPEGGFKPATIINLLATAWIQFQVHDWFFHVTNLEDEIEIPLPPGDTWPSGHMKLPRTVRDTPLDEADLVSPAYQNSETAWWDSSQIYGPSDEITIKRRGGAPHGKLLMIERDGQYYLPRDENGQPLAGFVANWWIGLELMHTLFALEHNSICDMLHAKNPDFSDDQLFDTARLINSALIAKIHTIEWTPAILAHPTLQIAMNANWWGLVGETLTKAVGRISKTSEIISGIPGSGVGNDEVPYSLTEEFVSVYRFHSLIPDSIAFFTAKTGAHKISVPIQDVTFTRAEDLFNSNTTTVGDALYSFGINYPGAITHNNMASFMRQLPDPDGVYRDMGAVDILRDRERGVPRYCTFRRLHHMPVPSTYLELTGGDSALAKELRDVYGPEPEGLEKVDLLIGSVCEPFPKGFGFSDTAFRVFILMASRRLKSDRFIAGEGWSENYYTKEGLKYVQDNTMSDVLRRHYPELAPALKGSKNPFAPWPKVGRSAQYRGVETNAPPSTKKPWWKSSSKAPPETKGKAVERKDETPSPETLVSAGKETDASNPETCPHGHGKTTTDEKRMTADSQATETTAVGMDETIASTANDTTDEAAINGNEKATSA